MERFAQYWDDFDDLLGIIGLCAERIRCFLVLLTTVAAFLGTLVGGILIALLDPPLALAIVTILLIFLMYRSVTGAIRPHATA